MSLHLVAWCFLYVLFAGLTFIRPIWGIALFFLTIFANPAYWWWGGPIAGWRVNYAAVLITATAMFVHGKLNFEFLRDPPARRAFIICGVILLNATLVQIFLAAEWDLSWEVYVKLWKYIIWFTLMLMLVRTPKDFNFLVLVLVCGLAYWGYEKALTGEFSGRLEKLKAPDASDANTASILVCMIIPLAGSLLFWGKGWEKFLGAFAAATGVELLNRFNSRGAFLAMIAAGGVFLLAASGRKVRKWAMISAALGLAAVVAFLARDPRVIARFNSIFNPPEQRDASAWYRVFAWKAASKMIVDYPLGCGGQAFKLSWIGQQYKAMVEPQVVAVVGKPDTPRRACHNGYLQEATDWGIQGLILKLMLLGNSVVATWQTIRTCKRRRAYMTAFVGACVLASIFAFLVGAVFVDLMDNETLFWVAGLGIFAWLYTKIVQPSNIGVERLAWPSGMRYRMGEAGWLSFS